MSKSFKIRAGIILLFVLLIFVHLIPLSINPYNALNDTKDCVLNTWIPNWVQQQLFVNPFKLFDANIFYPHTNTLSFSEHLFPQALISLPVYLLTKNPIAVYNFIFFFCFFLNAYGMFLLARHLTKNDLIGIACGIMFALNTFQINQITHLQLLSSGLIPLAFLYLHKYLEDRSLKNSLLFALFFTLQGLACVYYGLFFFSVLLFLFPVILLIRRKNVNLPFFLRLGVPLVFSAAFLILFSLPYLSFLNTYEFDRGLQKGADLVNYLAVDFTNVFLSKILTPLGEHEHYLFPGIIAVCSALFFLFKKRQIFALPPKIIRRAFVVFFMVYTILILSTVLTGGFTLNLGFFTVSLHNLAKQFLPFFLMGILYILLSLGLFVFKNIKKTTSENANLILYVSLGIWTLLLSLGGTFSFLGKSTSAVPLPFAWFFNHVPGFKGIRVPSRYAVFVIFCVVVLAAYGLKHVFENLDRKKARVWLAAGLFVFLNLEYLSVPQQMKKIPVKDDIPPAYTWLKDQPGDFVIASLPFFIEISMESNYQYFALYHKKKIINGYSGFVPPVTEYMRRLFKGFPSWPCVDILKTLDVKYVVFHPHLLNREMSAARVTRIERDYQDDLQRVQAFEYEFKKPNALSEYFGQDLIYEVIKYEEEPFVKDPALYSGLSLNEWSVDASSSRDLTLHLKDGDMRTRWKTAEPKKSGDYLMVEFKTPVDAAKISLFLGEFIQDYALNLTAKISSDGSEWMDIARPFSAGEFALDWIKAPLEPVQNVYLKGNQIKYVKIIHMGNDQKMLWSVAEMKVFVFSAQ